MSSNKASISSSQSRESASNEQEWTDQNREAWVSMVIAAATQSLRTTDLLSLDNGDQMPHGED